MLSGKQQEREIRRLKDILFPKKNSKRLELSVVDKSVQKGVNVFEQKTKRQHTYQLQYKEQHKMSSKSKIVKNPLQQCNDNNNLFIQQQSSNNHPIKIQYDVKQQYQQSRNDHVVEEKEKHQIKLQIDRLKSQISTMLNKWSDDHLQSSSLQQSTHRYLEKDQKLPIKISHQQLMMRNIQHMTQFQSHHQQLTRQHYLKNINQITLNLQKYNAYMYGIKQATQEMLQTVPIMEENYLIKLDNIRAYKLYYLGKLLIGYFANQIQKLRRNRLMAGMQCIKKVAELMDQQRKKEKQRRALNKGNDLFLRKNLLDKAFKKWRTNSLLVKFKDTLSKHLHPQIIGQNNTQQTAQNRIKSLKNNNSKTNLKDTQFFCKNILNKQSIIQFLQQYLLQVAKNIGEERKTEGLRTQLRNNNDVGASSYLNQEMEILFVDDQNSMKVFSYINHCDLLGERRCVNVSQERLQNVLQTIREDQQKTYQFFNTKSSYKKYSFNLKNSLTRMCIDSSKIIKMSEMKRNQIFSLEVDGSIGEQLWIKTAKTQREQQKNSQSILDKITLKKQTPIIKEEVFYEQQSLIDHQGYRYECPLIKTSAIFYPLLHENTLVGIIRQYIYHSSLISIQQFEIPFDNLQFVAESIFTTFELSYSFEKLRKERRLIENGYALKMVRMMRRVQNKVNEILRQVENEDESESEIVDKMMGVFAIEMSKFLSSQKARSNKNLLSMKQNAIEKNSWSMYVFRIKSKNEKYLLGSNKLQQQSQKKIKLVYQDKEEVRVQFQIVFQQKQVSNKRIDDRILHSVLTEFHQNSRNKQQNIMSDMVSGKIEKQQLAWRVILIKPSTAEGLYFCFTEMIKQQSIIYSNKDTLNQHPHELEHNLPPSQLLMNVMNNFTSTLNSTIERCNSIKYQLKHKQFMERQKIKQQINQNMRAFYLDRIKADAVKKINHWDECYGERKQNTVDEQITYIGRVNQFIISCANKLHDQLISGQKIQTTQNDNRDTFKISYTLTISMPKNKINNQQKQYQPKEQQTTNIKVTLTFTTEVQSASLLETKMINKNVDKLHCEIDYDVLSDQQSGEQRNEDNEVNNNVSLSLVLNHLDRNQSQSIFIQQQQEEITQTLYDIIANYFTFSKQMFLSQFDENHSIYKTEEHQANRVKKNKDNHNSLERIQLNVMDDKIIDDIKSKLLEQYLVVGREKRQDNESYHSLIETIKASAQFILHSTGMLLTPQQQQTHFTIDQQSIMRIVNAKGLSQENKIECRYYQFLSQQKLQFYQKILGSSISSALFQRVIMKLKGYESYHKKVMHMQYYNKITHNEESKSSFSKFGFNDIINSSYFVVLLSTKIKHSQQSLITIKVNNNLQLINQRRNNLLQIAENVSRQLSKVAEFIFDQYQTISRSNQFIRRIGRIMDGFNILIERKKMEKGNNLQNHTLLYNNIYQAFNAIKQHSHHTTYKASKLLSLSSLNKRNKNITLINSLRHWQLTTKYISAQEVKFIMRQKIVDNLQTSKQHTINLIQKVGTICCYDKILGCALRKMIFYAKHERIVDFDAYRLKFLSSAVQRIEEIFDRNSRLRMKMFFVKAADEMNMQRRQQGIMQKRVELFLLQLQYSKVYKQLVKGLLSECFNRVKMATTTSSSSQVKQDFLTNNSNSNPITQPFPQQTFDQQLTQSHSFKSLTETLTKQFPQYDIWVKPNKKIDEFFIVSFSTMTVYQLQEGNKNLSFDETSLVSSRLVNEKIEMVKINCNKLTKDEIYQLYEHNSQFVGIMETAQALFICRNILTITQSIQQQQHSQQSSFITQQTNLATQVVTLSTSTTPTTQLPFKQKQKLLSLSKCLQQFITHYKIHLNIKISYLESIYQTIKNKRYLLAMKRWKKYDQDLLLIKQYELTDTVYELNIETDNLREKIKQQNKEINENQNEYNRLFKKQQQQKEKFVKYQNNIQVLNKMLESYQKIQKREDDLLRSAAKSSARKMQSKLTTAYHGLKVELVELSHEEMGAMLLSLTRWRQINANEKLKQLRVSNFQKQLKILNRSVIDCQKSIQYHFSKCGFKQILWHSQRVKQQEIIEQNQKKQRIRLMQELEKQKQRQRQNEKQQKQKRQKENMQRMKVLENEKRKRQLEIKVDKQNQYFISNNNHNQTPTQLSLRDQLESSFNDLNRRLVTFQKNQLLENEKEQYNQYNDLQTIEADEKYFGNCDISEVERQFNKTQAELKSPLQLFKPPNTNTNTNTNNSNNNNNNNTATIDTIHEGQKMTEQEKIKFELQRMRMKKLQYNKENLTVTKEEYDRLNGGNGYKLGGKTLRFLKRMGKLQTSAGKQNQ